MKNKSFKKYKVFFPINTKLSDIDVYQNVNNFIFFSYFDTALNNFLIKKKIIDYRTGNVLDLVVENKCNFHESITFPCRLKIGFSVEKIGNTSVTYNLGIIKGNRIIADGYIVHVFVDRKTYKPKKINQKFRKILESIIA